MTGPRRPSLLRSVVVAALAGGFVGGLCPVVLAMCTVMPGQGSDMPDALGLLGCFLAPVCSVLLFPLGYAVSALVQVRSEAAAVLIMAIDGAIWGVALRLVVAAAGSALRSVRGTG